MPTETIASDLRIDAAIAALDARIARQLDEILHHPTFQRLERAWRGLWFVVERTPFSENIRIELLNCTKAELAADLANPGGPLKGAFYGLVYTAEIGRVGGEPFGAVITSFELDGGPDDLALLERSAAVSREALAPFIVAVNPAFLGVATFEDLPEPGSIPARLEGTDHTGYAAFRQTDEARYVGLVLPRFLLRAPFGELAGAGGAETFAYVEDVTGQHEDYCWGSAAYAFATRLADSFARYRWCPNIIGPNDGMVTELHIHRYRVDGEERTQLPTEIALSDSRELELSGEGFIPLVSRDGWNQACFFSANSAQKPRYFGSSEEGQAAEANYRLGTQLPYMFIMTRVMQYLKMMHRSHFEAWAARSDVEKELNDWVGQFVADRNPMPQGTRGRRMLRKARILVRESADEEGWHRLCLHVRPHFKFMGAFFTLTIENRLELPR